MSKNKFDLPITMFGSNKIILRFSTFAARHTGKDIYPPVEIIIFILFFFKKIRDFNIAKINKVIFFGNKIIFFVNGSTFIISKL